MKAKLIFLTLVTMFVAASVVAPRHPEAGLSNAAIDVTTLPPAHGTRTAVKDLWLATVLNDKSEVSRRENYQSPISDQEAIDIAIQKGEALKATRDSQTSYQPAADAQDSTGTAPASDPIETAATAPEAAPVETVAPATEVATGAEAEAPADTAIWLVTGDKVNLRAGPGTEHDIVGVAASGDPVTPLSGIGTDWVEIQRADGSLAWIFAKFVQPSDT